MTFNGADFTTWTLAGSATIGGALTPWAGLPTRLGTFPGAAARMGTEAFALRGGQRIRAAFVVGAEGALGTAVQAQLVFARSDAESVVTLTFATEAVAVTTAAGNVSAMATALPNGRHRIEASFEPGATADYTVRIGTGEATSKTMTLQGGGVVLDYRSALAAEVVSEDPKPLFVIAVDSRLTRTGSVETTGGALPGTGGARIAVATYLVDGKSYDEALKDAWAAARLNPYPSLAALRSGGSEASRIIQPGTAIGIRGKRAGDTFDAKLYDQSGSTGFTLNEVTANAAGGAPIWFVCDGEPGTVAIRTADADVTGGQTQRGMQWVRVPGLRMHNIRFEARLLNAHLGGDCSLLWVQGLEGTARYDPASFASIGMDDYLLAGNEFDCAPGRTITDLIKFNKCDGVRFLGNRLNCPTVDYNFPNIGVKPTKAVDQEMLDFVLGANLEVAYNSFTGAGSSPTNLKAGAFNLYIHHNYYNLRAAVGISDSGTVKQPQGPARPGGNGWSGDGIAGPGRGAYQYPGLTEHNQWIWAEAANVLITDNVFDIGWDASITQAGFNNPSWWGQQWPRVCLDLMNLRGALLRRNAFWGDASRVAAISVSASKTCWDSDQIEITGPTSAAIRATAVPPALYDAYVTRGNTSVGTPGAASVPPWAPWRAFRVHGVIADASNTYRTGWAQVIEGEYEIVHSLTVAPGTGNVSGDVVSTMTATATPPSTAGVGRGEWDRNVIRTWLGLL